jgi:hypothetical protein
MKRSIFLILLSISSPSTWAIFQGTISSGEHGPYQSAVQILSVENNQYVYRCSGTLITPDVVVTDSTCVQDPKTGALIEHLMISGKSHLDPSIPAIQNLFAIAGLVQGGVHHPKLNISLLFLHQAARFKPAIILSQEEDNQLRYLDTVTVAGYGFGEVQASENLLQRLTKDHQKQEVIIRRFGKNQIDHRTAGELFLVHKNGQNIACLGDEGGPVFAEVDSLSDNCQRLIGIISRSVNQISCKSPTRVLSIQHVRSFIDDSLKQACKAKTRVWCEVPGIIEPDFFNKSVVPSPLESHETHCPASDLLPEPAGQGGTDLPKQTEYARVPATLNEQDGEKQRPIIIENLGCRCTKTRRSR